ncbi:MAG: HD-GYP domain-containing protein [Spirochaetia bacterium]|jgi:HD-GYP domain-containing protein (c-di-GMP phosphodiesterase class II)
MKGMPLSELVPNTYFDQPVFLDKGFILLTPDSSVTPELVERLRKWKYSEVFTEGARKDVPSYLSGTEATGVGPQTIDEDIRANRQAAAAKAFYTELSGFASALFAAYVSDGVMNLGEVTEWTKKTIQMVHDNRDSLLRFVDMSADGDRYLISHAVNTTILSMAIGEFLKAPPHRLIELGNACLLHEIGMFKLPPELRRSSQPLSEEQKKVLATHTLLGYRILKGISAPENVALASLEHHERVDGTGYPRGLSGDKITEYAKIIAVACSYDAMISSRPFKSESLDGHSSIRDLLQKHRGHYDDRVLKAFVYTMSVYPVGTAVLLSNNSKGLVMKTDPTRPRCPIVRVFVDPEGRKLPDPPLVQVTEGKGGLAITRVLGAEDAKIIRDMT